MFRIVAKGEVDFEEPRVVERVIGYDRRIRECSTLVRY